MEALMPHTCDPESIWFIIPSPSFQNLILRSVVPPPLRSVFDLVQSRALIAASCQQNCSSLSVFRQSQMQTVLSLPPLASRVPLDFRLHISWLWNCWKSIAYFPLFASITLSLQSLPPVTNRFPSHSIAVILQWWFFLLRAIFSRKQSQVVSCPVTDPTAICVLVGANLMELMVSSTLWKWYLRYSPVSNSSPIDMLYRQRSLRRATPMKLPCAQSSRLVQQLSFHPLTRQLRRGFIDLFRR